MPSSQDVVTPRSQAHTAPSSEGVSRRGNPPGSRYQPRYCTHSQSFLEWTKIEIPGGYKLWRQLVVAFTLTAFFGVVLVITGAVFISRTFHMHHQNGISFPLTLCCVALVVGTLLIVGSVILGRMMISNKWRKNQHPTYSRYDDVRVRYRRAQRQPHGITVTEEIEFEAPPPYEGPPAYDDGLHPSGDVAIPPPLYFNDDTASISSRPPGYSITDPMARDEELGADLAIGTTAGPDGGNSVNSDGAQGGDSRERSASQRDGTTERVTPEGSRSHPVSIGHDATPPPTVPDIETPGGGNSHL